MRTNYSPEFMVYIVVLGILACILPIFYSYYRRKHIYLFQNKKIMKKQVRVFMHTSIIVLNIIYWIILYTTGTTIVNEFSVFAFPNPIVLAYVFFIAILNSGVSALYVGKIQQLFKKKKEYY